jgi:hypothetical protein
VGKQTLSGQLSPSGAAPVQRQADGPQPTAPAASTDWPAIIPRLQAKNHDSKTAANPRDAGIAIVHNDKDKAPTVTYDAKRSEQVGGQPDQVDAAIQGVVTARQAIPARNVTTDPLNGKKGNYYNANTDKSGASDAYQAGRATRHPSVHYDDKDVKDQRRWALFQKIWAHEGDPGIVTTFDKTLTIGAGFSSAGTQAEKVLGYALDHLPDAKATAFVAGLTVQGANMTAVDTQNKVIVSGAAAAAYVQTAPELISFISNLLIGAQLDAQDKPPDADAAAAQRQTMLDAQWVSFLSSTLTGIPDNILTTWAIGPASLAAHARHAVPGFFPWSVFAGVSPSAENVIRVIYQTLAAKGEARTWFHPIVNGEYDALGKKVASEEVAKAAKPMLDAEQKRADDGAMSTPSNPASQVSDGTDHE